MIAEIFALGIGAINVMALFIIIGMLVILLWQSI